MKSRVQYSWVGLDSRDEECIHADERAWPPILCFCLRAPGGSILQAVHLGLCPFAPTPQASRVKGKTSLGISRVTWSSHRATYPEFLRSRISRWQSLCLRVFFLQGGLSLEPARIPKRQDALPLLPQGPRRLLSLALCTSVAPAHFPRRPSRIDSSAKPTSSFRICLYLQCILVSAPWPPAPALQLLTPYPCLTRCAPCSTCPDLARRPALQ